MSTEKHFIVVSSSRGPSQYPARHNCASKAIAEAQRLARMSRGEKFYVYEAHCVCVSNDVTTTGLSEHFSEDDAIPF